MELEKLALRLRPRRASEAMGLGVRLVQSYFGPVARSWAVTAVPVALVIALLVPNGWGVVLVWWLLPLFDRVPLFVLSRALFGEVPGVGAVLRALPRMWTRALVLPLTFGRLSPFRCFILPVTELEGLRGRRRAERCMALRQDQGAVVRLAIGSAIQVFCLLLGLLALVAVFEKDLGSEKFDLRSFDPVELAALPISLTTRLVWVASLLLVEPFHLAAGFAMYLSRRQELEGWDIELTFRLLARRIREMPLGKLSSVGALLLCCLLGTASAQAPPRQGNDDPQAAIVQVLEHPDFGTKEKKHNLRFVPPKSCSQSLPKSCCMSGGGAGGVDGVRVLIGVSVVLVLVILTIVIFRGVSGRTARTRAERAAAKPAEVMGLDVRPESLPDRPGEAAWKLWESGQHAACLSLLYRTSLARLIHRHGIEIGRSFTESDCLRLVERVGKPPMAEYFDRLTGAWQSCAYAHRVPGAEQVRQLCDELEPRLGAER